MGRSNVPRYGSWENQDGIPYVMDSSLLVRGSAREMAEDNAKYRQLSNPPARNGNMDQSTPSYVAQMARPYRHERPSAGSELEHSLAKVTAPPARDRMNHETVRGKPARHWPFMSVLERDETHPDRGTAAPAFGDWKAAENSRNVFNRERDERNTTLAPAMNDPKEPSSLPHMIRPSDKRKSPIYDAEGLLSMALLPAQRMKTEWI